MTDRTTLDLKPPSGSSTHWWFFPFPLSRLLLPLLARSEISLSLSSPSQTSSKNIVHGSVSEYFLTDRQPCWLPCMEKFEFPSGLVL